MIGSLFLQLKADILTVENMLCLILIKLILTPLIIVLLAKLLYIQDLMPAIKIYL